MSAIGVGIGLGFARGSGHAVARYRVTASTLTPTAGGSAVVITAQRLHADGSNDATAGETVTWAKTGTGGSLSAATSTTNGSGVATVNLTVATVAGRVYSVQGTDGSGLTGAVSGITVQAAAASKYIVTPATLTPAAGAVDAITAQLADTYDNPVATAGNTVTWSKTGSGGSFASPTSATNSSGVATVNFTVATDAATNHTVTATDGGAVTGTSSTIDVVPGAIDHYAITPASLSPNAAATDAITAQAEDQYSNAVPSSGHTVTWSSTGVGGSFSAPTSTTNGSGVATVDFTTGAGGVTHTVTGTDENGKTGTSANIVVSNDPLGIAGLVTALGGDSAVLAFYDGRTGIALDGGGKLSTWDDARGGGFGPQRAGYGSPLPDVVSDEVITDGSQNYYATAVSSVFDLNVPKTIVWISTVPSSGANFPWVLQDLPFSKWHSIRGTDATVYWSLTSSHSRVALSNTRRMHLISHWGPSPSGGSWVGDAPKWFRGHSRIVESIDYSSTNYDTGYAQSCGSLVGIGLFSIAKERAMIVIDHVLDATEYDALAAWAVTHHGVAKDVGPPVIICNGNSLTWGQGASDRTTTAYPALVAANFPSYDVLSASAVGYRGAEMLAVLPKTILPLYEASRGVSAYVYWEGHNDLLFNSAAVVEANTHDACLAAKNRGFTVVVLTSPVSATITGAGAESKRVAYNTWIRANWASFADAIADVAQIPELSDYTDTTYFNGDQTHLTDAGYDKIANDATYGVTAALASLGL